MSDQPTPTVEEANQEWMVLQVQVTPALVRQAYLEGIVAGRLAERADQAEQPKARTRAK